MRFSKSTQKHVLWALTLNIAYKIYLFFRGKKFGCTRHPEKNYSFSK